MDDDDDTYHEYTFNSVEDIFVFVEWVRANFDDAEEYETWFLYAMDNDIPPTTFCTRGKKVEQPLHSCVDCKAQFLTRAGLDVHQKVVHKSKKKIQKQFWEIVNNSYENHQEETNDKGISDPD
jgi:hypothetical protein